MESLLVFSFAALGVSIFASAAELIRRGRASSSTGRIVPSAESSPPAPNPSEIGEQLRQLRARVDELEHWRSRTPRRAVTRATEYSEADRLLATQLLMMPTLLVLGAGASRLEGAEVSLPTIAGSIRPFLGEHLVTPRHDEPWTPRRGVVIQTAGESSLPLRGAALGGPLHYFAHEEGLRSSRILDTLIATRVRALLGYWSLSPEETAHLDDLLRSLTGSERT